MCTRAGRQPARGRCRPKFHDRASTEPRKASRSLSATAKALLIRRLARRSSTISALVRSPKQSSPAQSDVVVTRRADPRRCCVAREEQRHAFRSPLLCAMSGTAQRRRACGASLLLGGRSSSAPTLAPACAIVRRDGPGPRTTTAGRRPSQQRADARTGAPRQLLYREAGVSPDAPSGHEDSVVVGCSRRLWCR
jgi:hypothetical protein